MRRILIIYSPGAFARYGHAFDYVLGLGTALDKMDVEVHVMGWDGPLAFPGHIHEHRVPSSAVSRGDFRQFGILGDVIWGGMRILRQRQLTDALLSLYENMGSVYLLFETFEYIEVSRILKHLPKDNCSCIFHDTNFNIQHHSTIAAVYKRLVRHFARSILTSVKVAYVHGVEMKYNLSSTLNVKEVSDLSEKIQVIPYGAPHPDEAIQTKKGEAREKLGLSKIQHLLLAFGTLRKDKNFEFILKGLKNSVSWCLLVAGPEGDYTYEEIKRLSQRYSLEDRVITFPQFIPAAEHHLYFGASDVVINIYDENVRHESGTAQRARTFLKPVIVGGTPDLVSYVSSQGIGWTVDVTQPQSLVKALNEISSLGASGINALRQRVYECAVARSWDSVAKIVFHFSLS